MKKISLLIVTLVLCGCGGGNNSSSSSTNVKFDIIPKDTTTTAEEGGYGFENLAESLGYQTYILSENSSLRSVTFLCVNFLIQYFLLKRHFHSLIFTH